MKFRGDYLFTVSNDYVGRPYVLEGGRTGIMLDVGIDLATTRFSLVSDIYGDLLTASQLTSVMMCRGIVGHDATILLRNDLDLQSIEISIEDAISVFERVADDVWKMCSRRWPNLELAPDSVHTAVFDIAWDRNPLNRHLNIFDRLIRRKAWKALGEHISEMQQRGKSEAIALRRSRAARLILDELETEDAAA